MIEAVGWRGFGPFLGHCSGLLKPDGAMLLQAITIDDRAYAVEKATRSFIKEYIFPGGALPSLAVITSALARRTDLQVIGVEDMTGDYVETLQRWRRNLEDNVTVLAELGYDERFRRIWSLYLAYCEGGFAERRIGDVQILLGKPGFKARGRPRDMAILAG
jgi:cyclopropane-fatty-acyl-phospholipid synthase